MRPPRETTAGVDPRREMPATLSGRLDGVASALARLREEERRLGRLGFEPPLERCRRQRRYWEFLEALFSLAHPDIETARGTARSSWRGARIP